MIGGDGTWPGERDGVWPPQVALNGDWFEFEVVTMSGRAAAIRFRIRRDYVECWRGEHCCGVFDRDVLREWLMAMPRQGLVVDEVALKVDRMVDSNGRVAISLPDVMAWTLDPSAVHQLRERV